MWNYMIDFTEDWDKSSSFCKKFVRNLFWTDTFENDIVGVVLRGLVYSFFVNLLLFFAALLVIKIIAQHSIGIL